MQKSKFKTLKIIAASAGEVVAANNHSSLTRITESPHQIQWSLLDSWYRLGRRLPLFMSCNFNRIFIATYTVYTEQPSLQLSGMQAEVNTVPVAYIGQRNIQFYTRESSLIVQSHCLL